jgi:CheY-like chemotaxis protein
MKSLEILLVEDDPGDILLVQQSLSEGAYPVHVRVATDGEQALEMLESGGLRPDLIILDLNIPKVPGLLFLSRRHSQIPVVVFTSSANPNEKARVLELGAKEFVRKPLNLSAYKEAVLRMVRDWGRLASTSALA